MKIYIVVTFILHVLFVHFADAEENTTISTVIHPYSFENHSFGTSSSKSKIYFNAIDKAHEILEDDRNLAENVPSCVVVGMQSVGKSAILSRISGINFPQDSEICTRVAIELRLRRGKDHDSLKPMTIKAGKFDAKVVDKSDYNAVEKALKEAQTKVLNGRRFENKFSVKVEKEGVDLPEVTLIDLPGVFFAKDGRADHLESQVKNMIRDRVDNEMALILHVVPLNQDTDTISTWRTVRDADSKQERTILVLTKADLVLKDGKGKEILKKRIQKILTDSQSSECFVLHGAATSLDDELSQLSEVSNYIDELGLRDEIKVGVKELNIFIEERMLEHIKKNILEMRRLLENELSQSTDELKILGRQPVSPISIALRDSQLMKQHLVEAYEAFQPDYRRLIEKMIQDISDIDMKPLGLLDNEGAKRILQRNFLLYATVSQSTHDDHILALEAKKIAEDSRPMLNVPYVGKTLELKTWLQTFGFPLEVLLEKFIDEMFESFDRKVVQPSIHKGSSKSTKVVSQNLELQIKKNVIIAAKSNAVDYTNYLVDSVKENTFTSNDHYLVDKTKELEDTMNEFLENVKESYRLDMQRHFRVVCEIRAFFETRKKMLPDTIQLHFTKALKDLLKATEKEIGDQMLSKTSVDLIKESTSSIVRRKFHLEREKKIRNALDEIRLL